MSLFIVDASVGMKWFIPEVYQADAQRLQDPVHQPHQGGRRAVINQVTERDDAPAAHRQERRLMLVFESEEPDDSDD